MLLRLLRRSITRRPGKTIMALAAVAAAGALAAALLSVALDITDKMGRELRAFGANILVVPRRASVPLEIGGIRYGTVSEAAYLSDRDLPLLKTIFWRHNIVAFAPFLTSTASARGRRVTVVGTWFERDVTIPAANRKVVVRGRTVRDVPADRATFRTGLRSIASWWQVQGRWLDRHAGPDEAMIGRRLAGRLGVRVGDRLPVRGEGPGITATVAVAGIITTGGPEEEQLFVDLGLAQRLSGLPGRVERVQVSALVKPDDALAARARMAGPRALPEAEFVTWYCSPYMDAILYQIEEAIPGANARPIRQVADAEGAFLQKMTLTLAAVTLIALTVAGLAVTAVMSAQVLERQREIGLMQAIGADEAQIGLPLLLEAGMIGLLGGLAGAGVGLQLGRLIGIRVFGSPVGLIWSAPLVAVAIALVVSIAGSAGPVRAAMRIEPAAVLRGSHL